MQSVISVEGSNDAPKLDFLWLELTNRCNLQCSHCYSNSGPYSGDRDILTEEGYIKLIDDAYAYGCRQLQFIGGEPTLNRSLPRFIAHASEIGYEFIEVFTNLIKLDDSLLAVMRTNKISVATSFYSHNPRTHNHITRSIDGFTRTVCNIRRVLAANLDLRVGVIEMQENFGEYDATMQFLRGLGIENIGFDRVRGFGRGQTGEDCSMSELCGRCSTNVLAVGPDGEVAPCIMSKKWSVGSVLKSSLVEIVESRALEEIRVQILKAVGSRDATCYPECGPNRPQCVPECGPSQQCLPCGPNRGHKCQPNGWCGPGG